MSVKLTSILFALSLTIAACSHYEREPEFQSALSWGPYVGDDEPNITGAWPPPSTAIHTQRFVWKMRYIAEKLGEKVRDRMQGRAATLVTTIVPVENINKPTAFGRLCSEQLMTELSRYGFKVIEARKTKGLFIRNNEGEFSLSRDVKLLSEKFSADMALVGTFARSGSQVLLNVRLVNTANSDVLAAASAMMNLRGDKFLLSVFENENGYSGHEGNGARLDIRKKVFPETDPYAETLQSMARDMTRNISTPFVANTASTRKTIAVATFVDVDNMYRAATFGRYLTEQVMAELVRMGHDVVELRVSPDFYIDVRIGELALSREMSRVMTDKKVDAVVVGTYTRADENVVVNARMVMGGTRKVTGASSMVVDSSEKNKFVTAMLKNEITTVMPTETIEGY